MIVILADDLGYSDLGCYGGEIKTPSIDALAADGVRFTQLYNSARCCPSRASLMTGLYPSQAGIGDFTTSKPSPTRGPGYLGRLNDQCVTLAEVLKSAGYGCYYVGKWHMHEQTGPIRRGFDEFYGYTRGHSHDQYDADYYIRLPEGREKEIDPPRGEFYATDVFNEYALEFIRQGQESGKPWLLFLGHSSPHFPVQAPAERADKYEATYLRGWDVLRAERFERMQQLGLIDGDHWKLTPRSIVPVDREDIANGFPGKPNPAWDSLDDDRKRDLARRMAVFAAMVESIDEGVGQIVEHLEETGDFENTLILFLSDNGACYEWGPFGFDGTSRRGETTLHTGKDLRKIGGPGTHHSYGSGWANLGNTPLRLYKHFTHEGGISTPLIAHWPKGIGSPDRWIREPAHVMDIMPTVLCAAGAIYPETHAGNSITPMEGTSLLPVMRGESLPDRAIGFDHQEAHALRQGDWKLVWSKRMPHEIQWELYNLAEDRCETNDLAETHPDRVDAMAEAWEKWARRVNVTYESESISGDPVSPLIANRPLAISGDVECGQGVGVIVAQGGREHGYAVHLLNGKLAFDVRVSGQVTRIASDETVPQAFDFEAKLTSDSMTLTVEGEPCAEGVSPGLIPVQPKDSMNIGRDERTAAGDYTPPNRLRGTVRDLKVTTGKAASEP
jgi:arylsulfatase